MGNTEGAGHRPRSDTLVQHQLKGVRDTGRKIGDGSFATVMEVEYQGRRCAAKKLHTFLYEAANPSRKEAMLMAFEAECSLLSKLDHPSIVRFLGIYFKRGSQLPILMMEYVPTNLSSLLDTHGILPDIITYGILRDVALGLCYLHGMTPPVIHRDLSANNVLLTSNMYAKISDLGVAKFMSLNPDPMTQTQKPGTPSYMPPETMVAQPRYTTKLDVFSFGVLIVHMLTAQWPIPAEVFREDPTDPNQTLPVSELDRRSEFICKIQEDHPLMEQIQQCLRNNSTRRPDMAAVLEEIEYIIAQLPPSSVENRSQLVQQIVNPERKQIKQEAETKVTDTLRRVAFDISVEAHRSGFSNKYEYCTPPPSQSKLMRVNRQISDPVDVRELSLPSSLKANPLKNQPTPVWLLPAWQTMRGLTLPATALFEPTRHQQVCSNSDPTREDLCEDIPDQQLSSRSSSPLPAPSPPPIAEFQSLPLPSQLNDSPFTRRRAVRRHRAVDKEDPGVSSLPLRDRQEEIPEVQVTLETPIDSSSSEVHVQPPPLPPRPWHQVMDLSTHQPLEHSDVEQLTLSRLRHPMSLDLPNTYTRRLRNTDGSPLLPKLRKSVIQEKKVYFSKIFSGCPLHLNCAAIWIHPVTNLQYAILGAKEGLFTLLITDNPDPVMEQVSSRPCHWLRVVDNLLVWLSGHSRLISATSLILLFQSPQSDKTFSLRRNTRQHTNKIPDSKGCIKCCMIRNPFTDQKYLIAAVPRGILLMQWHQSRHAFMHVKFHKCRIPIPLNIFEAVVQEEEQLPRVYVGVQKGPDEGVLFNTINLNSYESSLTDSNGGETLVALNVKQLKRDCIFIGLDRCAKFVDCCGKLKTDTPQLTFEHKSEHMVCLPNCVLSFHRHGMQGKSLATQRVTAELTDKNRNFHLLGHFGTIVIETRPTDGATNAPSALYILVSTDPMPS